MYEIKALQCPVFAGCSVTGPTSVNLGASATFTVSWTMSGAGGGPFTVDFYRDGQTIKLGTQTGITGTSTTFTVSIPNWSLGSHSVTANIYYPCASTGFPENCDNNTNPFYFDVVQAGTTCTSISPCSLSGPLNINQGDSVTYTVTWSGGLSPYGAALVLDGTPVGSQLNVSGTSASITVPVNWSVGTHSMYARIWYTCPTDNNFWQCTSNSIAISVTSASSVSSCIPSCTLDTNFCISGNCVPKIAIYGGAAALVTMLLLKTLK